MTLKNRALPTDLLKQMLELRQDVYEDGMSLYKRWKKRIEKEDFHGSAQNLAFYIALRRRDIRDLQDELSTWGLSSLGRLESRTMSTIDAVISTLSRIIGRDIERYDYPESSSFQFGRYILQERAEELFGEILPERNTAIMVTVAKPEAGDYQAIKELIESGMNVIRINCAHDGPEVWQKIIDNVRKAEAETGKTCKVSMDIAGPKARVNWVLSARRRDRVTVGSSYFLCNKMETSVEDEDELKVGCSLPQILDNLKVGSRVLYDEGVIEGKVESVAEDGVIVRVTKTHRPRGVRLRVDKGLNFPGTKLRLPVITEKDELDLDFAVKHADIISFSFIKNKKDIRRCLAEIEKRNNTTNKPAIIAKIETLQGIDNLPDIIAEAAGKVNFGVMIARGDLAVETGYMRLAELQQQILWICEAADVPVVWATQVLDHMVSTGIPSRAEVTDAAEGAARAECVMLNRGDYIKESVSFLAEHLARMEANVYKKTPRLRALGIAKKVELEDVEA